MLLKKSIFHNMIKKYLVFFVVAVAFFASCSSEDTPRGGSGEEQTGKKVVVISDIHMNDLRAKQGGWGWLDERRSVLIDFLRDIAAHADQYSTLVVAGDMFDEWVSPMTSSPYQDLEGQDVRHESEYFQVLVRDNQDVLDAFRFVREAGVELVYVPGNHDLTCTAEDFNAYLPGLFTQARDAFGLGTYTPTDMPEVVIEHGHRYDYNNMPNPVSTPGGYYPIGYVVSKFACTARLNGAGSGSGGSSVFESLGALLGNPLAKVIYGQMLAKYGMSDWLTFEEFCQALMKLQADVEMVRQMQSSGSLGNIAINDLDHTAADVAWAMVLAEFPPKDIDGLFAMLFTDIQFPEPYAATYKFCDLIPYFHQPPVLFQNLWTTENWSQLCRANLIATPLPFVTSVLAGGVDTVLDDMASLQYFSNPASDKRIVIFGHTHKGKLTRQSNIKLQPCLYANTGCWIDDKWGNPASGTTFQTYVELQKSADSYRVTLREWGNPQPLGSEILNLK